MIYEGAEQAEIFRPISESVGDNIWTKSKKGVKLWTFVKTPKTDFCT